MAAGFQMGDRGTVVVHLLGKGALAYLCCLATGHQTGAKSLSELQNMPRFAGHFPGIPFMAFRLLAGLAKSSEMPGNSV